MVKTVVNTVSQVTAQILFNGAQEILGMDMLQKVMERLGHANISSQSVRHGDLPVAEVGPFMRALEDIYGKPGGQGLALRIGRAAFQYGLKQYGEQAGLRTMQFRLLPAPRRLESGLHSLAQIIASEYASKISVTDEGAYWQWRMTRQKAGQGCFLIAGLLQEFTAWAGGGRFYRVMETECQARGSRACTYHIEKRPID